MKSHCQGLQCIPFWVCWFPAVVALNESEDQEFVNGCHLCHFISNCQILRWTVKTKVFPIPIRKLLSQHVKLWFIYRKTFSFLSNSFHGQIYDDSTMHSTNDNSNKKNNNIAQLTFSIKVFPHNIHKIRQKEFFPQIMCTTNTTGRNVW